VSWPDVPRSRGPRAPCSPQQACGFRGVGRSTERSPSSSGCSRGSLTAWPTHCCISITLAEERAKPRTTASPSAWEEYTAAFVLLDRPDRPGNTERAIALLEAALRGDPRFARAHAALGRACWVRYRETRDAAWTDRARDAVQEAIRLAPEEASSRLALAMIYDGRGKREAALDAARRALELRPGFAENHDALGWVLFQTGRFGEASQAYRHETELQPDNAWAFQMLGTSLQLQGDLDGAIGAYREAIRHAKLGEREEALRAADRALEAGPAQADTRYGVAMIHALLGDDQRALALLGEALELGASPDLAERDDELARLRALPEFRRLIEESPAVPEGGEACVVSRCPCPPCCGLSCSSPLPSPVEAPQSTSRLWTSSRAASEVHRT
jgi:tetratricopeptide (TPR) repeat protein